MRAGYPDLDRVGRRNRSHGQGRSEKSSRSRGTGRRQSDAGGQPAGPAPIRDPETLETGIELVGTEVKSIRNGKANLRDGFCLIRNGELQLHNVHLTHAGSYFNHDPLRTRKLLAHRREIDKLRGLVDQKDLH